MYKGQSAMKESMWSKGQQECGRACQGGTWRRVFRPKCKMFLTGREGTETVSVAGTERAEGGPELQGQTLMSSSEF